VNARRVKAAADVIFRAQKNGHVTAAGWAAALESAQMLQSPESAAERAAAEDAVRVAGEALAELKREHAENARLRARVAELEAAAEQIQSLHLDSPMGPCPVCIDADAVIAGGDGLMGYPCPTARLAGAKDCDPPSFRDQAERSADRLTQLLAPTQALREVPDGEHYATVHHTYRLGHDLPAAGAQ
jgi:hypothetical protein